MNGYNPLRPETNGDYWAPRMGRPSRSHPAFKEISDDGLAIAQGWFDEAEQDQKAKEDMKARAAQYEAEHPEEVEAARAQFRAAF